jgi:hypothetical protein
MSRSSRPNNRGRDSQRIFLGELVIDLDLPIELYVELPREEVRIKAAVLKDRLAFLLDTRFRPSNPLAPEETGLTLVEVADRLQCGCRTVLSMITRGDLHPVSDEDGELHFDRAEMEKLVPGRLRVSEGIHDSTSITTHPASRN